MTAENDLQEIKTGNGVDRDLAATGNDRLKKAVIELRDLKQVIGTLNTNLVKFSNSSDRWSRKLVFLTWGLVALTVGVVILTGWLIKDAHDQVASENNIALNGQFYTPNSEALAGAIDRGDPILQPKGKFTTDQLDTYLGNFDEIDATYNEGLLSEDDLCNSFSYYIQITAKNAEVQKYLADNHLTPDGLTALVNVVNNIKDKNCHS
ncbi:MAG: hypothetical protein KGH79_00695 [Patescibacteria group bacterium]|nr:hypothetical protein [Patescibacteria group bacterium]